ncbi:hypothetical protein ABTB95_19625, partial [Acinetobacter baumannii]
VDTKYVEAEFMPRFIQERKAAIESGKVKPQPATISVAPPAGGTLAASSGAVQNKSERLAPRTFEVEVNQKQFKVAVAEL